MRVRREEPADVEAVRQVNQLAFGAEIEARIVDRIREDATPVISLVADDDGVVGHILFSPVSLPDDNEMLLMGLGPMAVTPGRQRQAIGSALVLAGLEECRRCGAGGVVMIGHPEFYPRFGFTPASQFGLTCEFDVPDEVFMALELIENALRGLGEPIRYSPAFSESS